jgi:ribosomal protein L11 methyltransferase
MSAGADSWIEVQVELPAGIAEILAVEVGERCGGVEIRDPDTLLSTAPGREAVVALVATEDLADVLALIEGVLATARAGGGDVDPVTIRQRPAHEDEWRDVWKQFFRTTRIGRRFVVRPSWDPDGGGAADQVIELDPGRAFGTGAHPSTRLVIAALEDLADQGHRVDRFLDLGCGSGILAIAAGRLWPAARGLAVDNDAEAVACTGENLERNGVASVNLLTGTLDDVTLATARAAPFDLVMANIQLNVLEQLAPELGAVLAGEGRLVLSGLLLEDAGPARAAYLAAGFQVVAAREEGEWASLVLAAAGPASGPAQ